MDLHGQFVPAANVVGLLPMLTYYVLVVTMYAFGANLLFFVLERHRFPAEHRLASTYSVLIAAVAGLSYYYMQTYYQLLLADVAEQPDPGLRQALINEGYHVIGQYRYMDWAITTPLLLLKMVATLTITFHRERRAISLLLLADLFMIVTGYVGEQQLSPAGDALTGPKLFWGAVSTLGYVVIPVLLLRFWRQYGPGAEPEARWAYRLMALTTVTSWGVYPIGFILSVLAIDLNSLHIAFSLADVVNKIGVAAVSYQAATALARRHVVEATRS